MIQIFKKILLYFGHIPTPGVVSQYWVTYLFLALPSLPMALRVAVTEIATHSVHYVGKSENNNLIFFYFFLNT